MTEKTHPNAVEIHGKPHLKDAKGNFVPMANIRPMDLLQDEMVGKIRAYAEDLSAELARFQFHTYADIADLDALMAQEYNVQPTEGGKGNRTYISFDGCTRVQVAVSDRIVLGPQLQQAKVILDAIINERGEGVDSVLVALVKQAFKVDQEGKVDMHSIFALRRMQVDDDRWPDFCRAIDDSVQVLGSKRYLRIHTRDSNDGKWEMIPLDMAAIEPSAAAFERKSLRRQVEELKDRLAQAESTIAALTDEDDETFVPVVTFERVAQL